MKTTYDPFQGLCAGIKMFRAEDNDSPLLYGSIHIVCSTPHGQGQQICQEVMDCIINGTLKLAIEGNGRVDDGLEQDENIEEESINDTKTS